LCFNFTDMLPGPVPPPPPLLLVFTGSPGSPPSDPQSSSTGASVAIITIVIIAAITLTTCIVLLRRGCLRRQGRLSSSSFSCCSSESGMRSATSAAVASAVVHSAEGPVKGSELVASGPVPVSAEMPKGRMDTLVPSAPYLPDVERLILGLLLLPAVPMKPGSRDCAMCREFLPTEVLLILPVCSHMFHQSCIITWLCRTTPPCCPFCHASIIIPGCNKTKVDPSFCSVEYDIESQMLMPTPPGEVVAEAVGGSHGWLRSSLDRLSGSWRECSSNRATPAVVPVSSRRTTGSWSHGNDSDCSKVQKPLPVPDGKEVPEEVRRSIGWLGSLATLSGSWSGCSSSCSSEMGLMVTLRHVKETLTSSGHSETDKWSMRWDLEAATPTPERPSLYGYARWFFRSSGK
jgi:hypothetical protein